MGKTGVALRRDAAPAHAAAAAASAAFSASLSALLAIPALTCN